MKNADNRMGLARNLANNTGYILTTMEGYDLCDAVCECDEAMQYISKALNALEDKALESLLRDGYSIFEIYGVPIHDDLAMIGHILYTGKMRVSEINEDQFDILREYNGYRFLSYDFAYHDKEKYIEIGFIEDEIKDILEEMDFPNYKMIRKVQDINDAISAVGYDINSDEIQDILKSLINDKERV